MFRKTHEKTLAVESFLIKLYNCSLQPATLITKRIRQRCIPINFSKFLITPFLPNIFCQLFLVKRRTMLALEQAWFTEIPSFFQLEITIIFKTVLLFISGSCVVHTVSERMMYNFSRKTKCNVKRQNYPANKHLLVQIQQ